MKKIHVQENAHYKILENRDDYCRDVLSHQMSAIRFDIVQEKDNDELVQRWRAKITLDDEDSLNVEMKDYYSNERRNYSLDDDVRFSDATLKILGIAWSLLEEEQFGKLVK